MALNFSPGQYASRAALYYQVAQFLSAGIPLTTALEHVERNPPSRRHREPLRLIREDLVQHGLTFAEALGRCDGYVSDFELALFEAGEKSGRLDSCFHLLADFYNQRAQTLRTMLADFIYPALLFHIAVLLLPFPALFLSGDVVQYVKSTAVILLPVYAFVIVLVLALQGSHGEGWRARVETLLSAVPLVGGARKSLAMARLSGALESLLMAGVSIIEAWEMSAAASGSPRFRRVVAGWRKPLEEGLTPSEMVNDSGLFPNLFSEQYTTAELSGKLEETLGRLSRYYNEEATQRLRALATWAPRLFYFGVVFYVAYRVLTFYSNHFRMIMDASGM